jgi:xanthine phosphoribosyltransferase
MKNYRFRYGGKMELLKNTILTKGRIIGKDILKVDSFINHQIDPKLMMAMGEEFKRRFSGAKITKVLTIEASGIAVAMGAAYALGVDFVFAKKKKPVTIDGNTIVKTVKSFTKNIDYDIMISTEYIEKHDIVLIVDDFLAHGNAAKALVEIVRERGAEVAGVGIVIEKGFQKGRTVLESEGIKVESLAIIKSFENGIEFA